MIATHTALSHSRGQTNLTVEQGPPLRKAKIKKSLKDKAKNEATQTKHKDQKSK